MQRRPQLIVVAGPNGVGKSTYSRSAFASGFLLLDPDRYGISPKTEAPVAAARLVVERVAAALARGEDLVLETTLSGKFPMKAIATGVRAGYDVTLVYIGVDDPDECIRRVRERVSRGGHDVPEVDIRRRFRRSIETLPIAIASVHRVTLHDNSADRPYRLIARADLLMTSIADDVPSWAASAVAALRRRM